MFIQESASQLSEAKNGSAQLVGPTEGAWPRTASPNPSTLVAVGSGAHDCGTDHEDKLLGPLWIGADGLRLLLGPRGDTVMLLAENEPAAVPVAVRDRGALVPLTAAIPVAP